MRKPPSLPSEKVAEFKDFFSVGRRGVRVMNDVLVAFCLEKRVGRKGREGEGKRVGVTYVKSV